MSQSQLFTRADRVLILLVVLLLSSSCAYAETIIIDNFNDNSLDTSLWSPIFLGNGFVSEINGRLEATIPALGGRSGVTFAGVGLFVIIAGDFDLTFGYTLLAPMPLIDHDPGAGILLGDTLDPDTFNPYIGIGRGIKTDDPNHIVNAYTAGLGRTDPNEFKIPADDMSGILRLTREGDIVSAYYWGGSDWQLIASASGLSETASSLILGVQIIGPEMVSAAFDDFRLQVDDPTPEPASLVLLGTGLGTLGLAVWRRKK